MAVMESFRAVDKWYNNHEDNIPLIYLGGIEHKTLNWQERAIELLGASDKQIYIANPSRVLPTKDTEEWAIQVEWEIYHQRVASSIGAVMFWLEDNEHSNYNIDKDIFNIAEWQLHLRYRAKIDPNRSLKFVLGIDNEFDGAQYIKYRLSQDMPDFHIFSSLSDTCDATIKLL